MQTFRTCCLCAVCALALLSCLPGSAAGQTTAAPIGKEAHATVDVANTPAQNAEWAWSILTSSVNDMKHPDLRIQALAALGLMGSNPHSVDLITSTLTDANMDVRAAGALAAGQTKAPAIAAALRRTMDDKEPQVAFAAALALWKMGDQSGEDILLAVVDGERSANATLMNGTMHSMNKDLHDPAKLARIGAMQGAGMLLGPFGYGITAYEYLHKSGGDSARVLAVEQIAENHTAPIRAKLLAALMDKDVGVRVAAAKGLASFHEADVPPALALLFPDAKTPLRLTAAAAYLSSSRATAGPKLYPDRAK